MSDPVSFHADGPEPPAIPFDPAGGALPREVERGIGRAEPVVLLLDAAGNGQRAWAADAAVALAAGWARAGRRVVLADLHLEDPVLHERLGEPNLDGIVDIFMYGASLARTARPVSGRGFYLISPGTYPDDVAAVLRSPRWAKIVAGFNDAHASLVLFAPAGTPGLEELAAHVRSVLVLGTGDAALAVGPRARAVLVPPGTAPREEPRTPDDGWGVGVFADPPFAAPVPPALPPPPEPVREAGPAAPDDTESEVVPWVDPYQERPDPLIGEYAHGIPASTLPPGAVPVREPDLRDPPVVVPEGRSPRPGRRRVPTLLLVLLALVVLGAAAYLVLQTYPDVLTRLRGGDPPRAAAVASAPAPAPVEAPPAHPAPETLPAPAASAPATASVALPYSVQTKAFASLAAARQMVRNESRRFTDAPLYISPELVDRVLYYKVYAGILPDTVQAARVRQRLVETGVVEGSDAQEAWSLIRHTPLAFDLGEYPTRTAADARADSLTSAGVPTYAVAVRSRGGPDRWRLYGGAFPDSVGAEGMRRILNKWRFQAHLVKRVGPRPAA